MPTLCIYNVISYVYIYIFDLNIDIKIRASLPFWMQHWILETFTNTKSKYHKCTEKSAICWHIFCRMSKIKILKPHLQSFLLVHCKVLVNTQILSRLHFAEKWGVTSILVWRYTCVCWYTVTTGNEVIIGVWGNNHLWRCNNNCYHITVKQESSAFTRPVFCIWQREKPYSSNIF